MREIINIIESLNSSPILQWSDKSNEDIKVVHAEFQLDDGHFIIQFSKKYYDGVWTVNFTRNGTFNMTGTGKQFAVMSAVNDACETFISTYRPLMIQFEAAKADKGRSNLYMRLARMAMGNHPEYRLESQKTTGDMGGVGPQEIVTFARDPDPFVAPEKSKEELEYEEQVKKDREEWEKMSPEQRQAALDELERLFNL